MFSCTVRVIKSSRPGVGKTLYKRRKVEELDLVLQKREKIKRENAITIPILDKKVDIDDVMSFLLRKIESDMDTKPRIFHIDFSQEVNICNFKTKYFMSIIKMILINYII